MSEPRDADWALLHLAPGASREELEHAYQRRRALYDPGSLATYSLLSDEERRAFLETLEAAYRRLLTVCPPAGAVPRSAASGPAVETSSETPAVLLRRLREAQGVSFATIAARTKIRPPILEALEAEDWAKLPAPVYLRAFVVQIGRLLGVPDPEGLARRYLARRPAGTEAGRR